ncbi:MAG: PorP/SprF family type IX secretion system membrane protein [Bacteroidia bacterium]
MQYTSTFRFILCAFLLMGMGKLSAQDLAFTQFFANKIYLNPAYSGYEYGTNIYTNYRVQWAGIGGSPSYFTSQAIAASSEANHSGFSLLAVDRQFGPGPYRWQKFGAGYAWKTQDCRDGNRYGQKFDFSLGVRTTYNITSLDLNGFTFSSQYNPIYGLVQGSSSSLAGVDMLQGSYWDVDAGGLVEFTSADDNFIRLGIAANNLARINPSIGLLNDTIGVRWTVHGSMELGRKLGLKIPLTISPTFKYEQQRSFGVTRGYMYRTFDGGLMAQYSSGSGHEVAFGGMWHFAGLTKPRLDSARAVLDLFDGTRQATNGVSMYFAFQQPLKTGTAVRASVSYQFDYTGLRSNSAGILEFGLAFKFGHADLVGCRRGKGRNGNVRCANF